MKRTPRTLLIVDDEPGMLKILEKRLVVDGYRVINAVNGTVAIEKAKHEMPDLILADIMMPNLSGTDMAKQLRVDPLTKDIPIIFITAMIGVETDKGNEELEVDGQFYRVFAKPLHNRKLLSVIRKTINRRENNN